MSRTVKKIVSEELYFSLAKTSFDAGERDGKLMLALLASWSTGRYGKYARFLLSSAEGACFTDKEISEFIRESNLAPRIRYRPSCRLLTYIIELALLVYFYGLISICFYDAWVDSNSNEMMSEFVKFIIITCYTAFTLIPGGKGTLKKEVRRWEELKSFYGE